MMYGYGGMGHYYARQNYDKRCPTCEGKGSYAREGFIMTCEECFGTGLRPDPKIGPLTWIAMALVVLIGISLIVLYAAGVIG